MMSGDKSDEIISSEIVERLHLFFEDNDTERISKSVRRIFFSHLKFQQGNMDADFPELLHDVESLIDLLEFISKQTDKRR